LLLNTYVLPANSLNAGTIYRLLNFNSPDIFCLRSQVHFFLEPSKLDQAVMFGLVFGGTRFQSVKRYLLFLYFIHSRTKHFPETFSLITRNLRHSHVFERHKIWVECFIHRNLLCFENHVGCYASEPIIPLMKSARKKENQPHMSYVIVISSPGTVLYGAK
jgi:hypothetical protein